MSEISLGDAIRQFLNKSKLKQNIQALQIEDAWAQLMGPTIAKYTQKIELVKNTLFITTDVAALKQELLFQKDKIIQRVNETLEQEVVKDVVIK